MATTTAAILTLSTSPFSSHQGLQAFPRALRCYNIKRCILGFKKDSTAKITAKFELKPPPYGLDALEPHMSRSTLEYHWGKHHRTYVENLNKQIAGTDLGELSLEDAIVSAYNQGNPHPAFNNAAQAWNHQFFWESMKPGGGGKPSGELLRLIERDFGSFEGFVKEFRAAATTQFGSGWAWLTYNTPNAKNSSPSDEDKKLVVVNSPNAINPLTWNQIPLLTIDVWEHAYYLDFQNRRPDYVSIFMEKLVSWEAVSSRLEEAKAKAFFHVRTKDLFYEVNKSTLRFIQMLSGSDQRCELIRPEIEELTSLASISNLTTDNWI